MRYVFYTLQALWVTMLSFTALPLTTWAQPSTPLNEVPVLRIEKGEFPSTGTTRCTEVTLSNQGEQSLLVTNLTWSNGNVGYWIDGVLAMPFFIEAGEQITFPVCYSGPETSLPNDTLNITSNNRPSVAWGFLMDASVSMDTTMPCPQDTARRRIEEAQSIAQLLIDSVLLDRTDLRLQDQFSLSSYTSKREGFGFVPIVQNLMPLVSTTLTSRNEGSAAVNSIKLIGGTWTGHALRAMIDTLKQSNLPTRVIVLLTDGQTNDEDLSLNPVSEIIREAREANVQIVGVRLGFNYTRLDSYLIELADSTKGMFLKASTCNELENIPQKIAIHPYSRTIDREPFPSGHTLSTSIEVRADRAANTVTIQQVSPNPAQDFAEILVFVKNPGMSTVSLYTTNGALALQKEVQTTHSSQNTRIKLETGSIAPGAYLLVVEDEVGGKDQAKLVVISNGQ